MFIYTNSRCAKHAECTTKSVLHDVHNTQYNNTQCHYTMPTCLEVEKFPVFYPTEKFFLQKHTKMAATHQLITSCSFFIKK